MAINISTLFADIIDTPEQRKQKMLQQGMMEGQMLSSGLTGRARALAPLAQMAGQLGVQRNEDLRRAVQPMLGIDPRTTGEKVQEQIQGLDPNDPNSMLKIAQALQSIDPVRAASLRQLAAQKKQEQDTQKTQNDLNALRIEETKINIAAGKREAQEYLDTADLRERLQVANVEAAELSNQELASKINNPSENDTFERDTQTYPSTGLTIYTTGLGRKIVKDINGNILTGDEASLAVQEALDAQVQQAAAIRQAQTSGSQYAEIANTALNTAGSLTAQVGLLNSAISEIDRGAKVGTFDRLLAPFNANTAALQTVQNELGLGVISSTTFGALSQGELDLALQINAPATNDEQALKEWYIAKSAAVQKLAEAAKQQAIYFSNPGASIPGWITLQESVKAEREIREQALASGAENNPSRQKALEDLGLVPKKPTRSRRGRPL